MFQSGNHYWQQKSFVWNIFHRTTRLSSIKRGRKKKWHFSQYQWFQYKQFTMNQTIYHQKMRSQSRALPQVWTLSQYPSSWIQFWKEVECLPFKVNLGDVPLDKEHQTKFIELIDSNQEVFSLHDKDLGYCDHLTHTILTSTDKPVYLPHRSILKQCQGEVGECLNTWMHQEIIHPSNSPYASQVVIVHNKSGEISLCGL